MLLYDVALVATSIAFGVSACYRRIDAWIVVTYAAVPWPCGVFGSRLGARELEVEDRQGPGRDDLLEALHLDILRAELLLGFFYVLMLIGNLIMSTRAVSSPSSTSSSALCSAFWAATRLHNELYSVS